MTILELLAYFITALLRSARFWLHDYWLHNDVRNHSDIMTTYRHASVLFYVSLRNIHTYFTVYLKSCCFQQYSIHLSQRHHMLPLEDFVTC
jgi:hypothetical protein